MLPRISDVPLVLSENGSEESKMEQSSQEEEGSGSGAGGEGAERRWRVRAPPPLCRWPFYTKCVHAWEREANSGCWKSGCPFGNIMPIYKVKSLRPNLRALSWGEGEAGIWAGLTPAQGPLLPASLVLKVLVGPAVASGFAQGLQPRICLLARSPLTGRSITLRSLVLHHLHYP